MIEQSNSNQEVLGSNFTNSSAKRTQSHTQPVIQSWHGDRIIGQKFQALTGCSHAGWIRNLKMKCYHLKILKYVAAVLIRKKKMPVHHLVSWKC